MYALGGAFGRALGGALGCAPGGGGSSRELEGLPPPRDGEGSRDEADAPLCDCVRVGSGIGTPSGEIYWICYGEVKWVGAP